MNTATNTVEDFIQSEYKYGFVTDIEADTVAPGLNEDVIRLISAKKNEPTFMLEWRLKAYRHWVKLEKSQAEPKWASPLSSHRLSSDQLLLGTEVQGRWAEELRGSRSRTAENL